MLIRFGSAKIVKVASTLTGLAKGWNGGLLKRASMNMENLNLDPENHVYLRNRAVSALELHGPNQNSDAFEYDELDKKYGTFIGKAISVDHIGTSKIGTVLDSEFIRTPEVRSSFGLPLMPIAATIDSLNSLCSRNKDVMCRVLAYADQRNLVRGSDQKMIVEAVCRSMANSGWVENVWAIEREAAEEHTPGLVQAILDNEITDSSMGCVVNQAVCSACGNIATGELPEHEDFCDCIRLFKGKQFNFQGMMLIPFEINRDIEFFEDSLILPHRFGGKAGGEGADAQAKFLEVFADRRVVSASKKRAYTETTKSFGPHVPSNRSDNLYTMVGDMPDIVEKNRQQFLDERKDEIKKHIDEQNAPGTYPEGTIIHIKYEGEETDAVVVDEYEDGTLVVAIENLDEPVEIGQQDILEVIEYPDDMNYEDRMDAVDTDDSELHPESRAASINVK